MTMFLPSVKPVSLKPWRIGPLAPKRLQLLHEVVPTAAAITLLVNPANPVEAESQTKELQAAAPALGLQLRVAEVTTLDAVERVFTAVASDGKGPFS